MSFACSYIAVYGTLRQGWGANDYLNGCDFIGYDKVSGALYRVGGFPGLRPDEEGRETVVEVYRLPNEEALAERVIETLDRYEGYNPDEERSSLFLRRKTKTLDPAFPKEVSVYVYPRQVNPDHLIPDGDWNNA